MDCEWLKQSAGASEVIVFFGGWAVGPGPILHLEGAADVLFVSDYRALNTPLPDLSRYARRKLAAWSFGVGAYGVWAQGREDFFHSRTAICGAPKPIDRLEGVPPAAMRATIRGLSVQNYQLFLKRCFGAAQPSAKINIDARREELKAVLAQDYTRRAASWDRVWISKQDEIFPLENMRRAWAGAAAQEIDAPHAPFANWTRWDDFLA